MTTLLFPFFIVQLIFLNTKFFTKVFFYKTDFLKLIVVLTLTLGVTGLFFNKAIHTTAAADNTPPPRSDEEIFTTSLKYNNVDVYTEILEINNINKKILFYEKLHQQQPTHRDVLTNLYILEDIMKNNDVSINYLNKARTSDPNNSLF